MLLEGLPCWYSKVARQHHDVGGWSRTIAVELGYTPPKTNMFDIVVSGTGLETGTVLERQEIYNMFDPQKRQETAT